MFKLNYLLVFILMLTILSGCAGNKPQPEPGRQQAASETDSRPAQTKDQPAPENQGAQSPPLVQRPAADAPRVQEPPPPPPAAPQQNYSLQAGDIFPPFTLADLNGNKTESAGLFAGNKVTLVNFWATFCGPCIKEMPELEELRKKYSGQNLGMAGIVLDSNKASTAIDLAARIGTGYPHLLDDGRFAAKIFAVPQTLLVDSDGKILVSVTGARSLQEFSRMVEPYLK